MEPNTIIRTEDSINMGGSFLNETQVRLRGHQCQAILTLSLSYTRTLDCSIVHISQFRIVGSISPGITITTYLLSPGAQPVPVSALLLHLPPV